jgi:hypothetical protein
MKTAEAMAIRTSKANRTILAIIAIPLKNSGSSAILAAIRRVSSLLSSLG